MVAAESVSAFDRKVIYLLACGLQAKEVGLALDVLASAVDNRLRRLRARLGVRTTVELVAYSLCVGIVPHSHTRTFPS